MLVRKSGQMIKLIKLLAFSTLLLMTVFASAEDVVDPEYKNPKMGFELSYPQSWKISEDSDTSASLSRFLEERNQVVFISFFLQKNINPEVLPISDWFMEMLENYKKNGITPPKSINTELGGKPVVLLEHNGKLGTSYTYYWSLNTNVLSMNFYPDKDIKGDIEKILSTINIYESN